MRDAFGGAFMIQLFLVFILIYVSFTAVALNYAKAFKAKNIIVSYLEEHEVSTIGNEMTAEAESEMREYFEKELVGGINYVFPTSCNATNTNTRCYEDIGVMIEEIEPTDSQKNKLGVYYKVTTYFGFQLPFFDRLLAVSGRNNGQNVVGRWTIVGESRPIAFEEET